LLIAHYFLSVQKPKGLMQQHLLDVLWNWRRNDSNAQRRVKLFLMPDDDPNSILFHVVAHPTLDDNTGSIVMHYCEINVSDVEDQHVCNIFVDGSTGNAVYKFREQ
jgi:hypothetical protein